VPIFWNCRSCVSLGHYRYHLPSFEWFKRVVQNLPEHLRNSNEIVQAIAEQINYATASPQFEGDDEEMRRKLKVVFDKLLRNGADKAANELASAVDMRPHYLAMAEQIMR
jgi:hypothetical protein